MHFPACLSFYRQRPLATPRTNPLSREGAWIIASAFLAVLVSA